jgi:hypothetical protein
LGSGSGISSWSGRGGGHGGVVDVRTGRIGAAACDGLEDVNMARVV